jgi:hypothetical protein
MIITRPKSGEVDFLPGLINEALFIKDFDSNVVATLAAPDGGWSHDELESINFYNYSQHYWDVYLGDVWVGSSEV